MVHRFSIIYICIGASLQLSSTRSVSDRLSLLYKFLKKITFSPTHVGIGIIGTFPYE